MSGTGNIRIRMGFGLKSTSARLYTHYRATRVIIARRYQELISGWLLRAPPCAGKSGVPACMACRWILALTPKNPAGVIILTWKRARCACALPLFPFE